MNAIQCISLSMEWSYNIKTVQYFILKSGCTSQLGSMEWGVECVGGNKNKRLF